VLNFGRRSSIHILVICASAASSKELQIFQSDSDALAREQVAADSECGGAAPPLVGRWVGGEHTSRQQKIAAGRSLSAQNSGGRRRVDMSRICALLPLLAAVAVSAHTHQHCAIDKLTIYKVVVTTFWTRERFPKHYPDWRPPAQWSKTVGKSFQDIYNFFFRFFEFYLVVHVF
jgi:Spondin_N